MTNWSLRAAPVDGAVASAAVAAAKAVDRAAASLPERALQGPALRAVKRANSSNLAVKASRVPAPTKVVAERCGPMASRVVKASSDLTAVGVKVSIVGDAAADSGRRVRKMGPRRPRAGGSRARH